MVWVLVPDRPVWVFFTNCWSTGIVTTSQPSLGFYRRWSEEREYAVTSSSLDWCQGSGENGQSGIGWQKGNSNTGSPKLGIIGLGGCFHLMAGDRSQEEKSSFVAEDLSERKMQICGAVSRCSNRSNQSKSVSSSFHLNSRHPCASL